jgi:hypothetical protein
MQLRRIWRAKQNEGCIERRIERIILAISQISVISRSEQFFGDVVSLAENQQTSIGSLLIHPSPITYSL